MSLITIAVGHRRDIIHTHTPLPIQNVWGGGNFDRIGANLSLPYLASDNISDISQCHNLM